VTVSSDLSDDLNGPLRALTAALNARIVSLIVALVAAVRSALARQGISATLMIVKGDGSIATAEAVAESHVSGERLQLRERRHGHLTSPRACGPLRRTPRSACPNRA